MSPERMSKNLDSANENTFEKNKIFDKRVDSKRSAAEAKPKTNDFDSRIETPTMGHLDIHHGKNDVFDKRVDAEPKQNKDISNSEGHKFDINSKEIRTYLTDVQRITGFKITKEHKAKMSEHLASNEIKKLPSEQTELKRAQFNINKRLLIQKWEKETENKWPRYEKDVKNKFGMVVRKAGALYDAHHIIELSHGGPNKSWNIIPARYPDQHQNGIHKTESAKRLFGG